MKSRTSPTSPKNQQIIDELYRVEPTIQKPVTRSFGLTLIVVIVSIIGSVGAFMGLKILADRHPLYRILQPFRSSPSSTEKIIIQQQSSEKTVAAVDTVTAVESSLATVVHQRPSGLPQSSDWVGNGTIISSNGTAVMVGTPSLPPESIIRTRAGQNIPIIDHQTDPFTGIVVVHSNAQTTAIPFANDQSITIGMPVFIIKYDVFSAGSSVVPSTITSLHARAIGQNTGSLIESSEKLNRLIVLADPVDDSWVGASVVNEKGELVGIISQSDAPLGAQVIPVPFIRQLTALYQPGNPISRPFLGVKSLDLAYAPIGKDQLAKGARIDSDDARKTPPVTLKSPAASAGLRQGDVIVSIDSIPLNDTMSLSEALSSYKVSSTIEVTIIRQSKELRLRVTLSSNSAE